MNSLPSMPRIDLELPANPSFDDLVAIGHQVVEIREAMKFALGQLARLVSDLHGTKYGEHTLIRYAESIGMEHPKQIYAYRDVWDFWGGPCALPHLFWSHYRLLQLRLSNRNQAESWLAYASQERLGVRQLSALLDQALERAESIQEALPEPRLDSRYRYQIPGRWKGDAVLSRCTVQPDGVHLELIIPLDAAGDIEALAQNSTLAIALEAF